MSDNFINVYNRFPITLEYGYDSTLVDAKGNEYLDFVSGIAVNCLGYSNVNYKNSLKKQIDQLMHCSNLYNHKVGEDFAEKLLNLAKMDQAFFCNSGTESMEAALKLARVYANKTKGDDAYKIISMKNSFHGRTYGALSITGQEKYHKHLKPLLPEVVHVDFNNKEALISAVTEDVCAIIIEPIQGEGGIITAEKGYLKFVRKLCDDKNIILIFDEVQTGIGRTGKMFAYEHFDIQPDIVALAKGLGGGFPMGAILAKDFVANAFEPGLHASTFGGNLLACSAGLAVLEEFESLNLLKHIDEMAKILTESLNDMKHNLECIIETKGLGLMQGLRVKDINLKELCNQCLVNGLLVITAGTDTIRIVPPLTISQKDLTLGLKTLRKTLQSL